MTRIPFTVALFLLGSVILPAHAAAQSSTDAATPVLSDSVVVTAQRAKTPLVETPQKVEVVDRADLDRAVAADLTDLLKKNAGVDVIQYSGVLSGIGIR